MDVPARVKRAGSSRQILCLPKPAGELEKLMTKLGEQNLK